MVIEAVTDGVAGDATMEWRDRWDCEHELHDVILYV